MDWNRTVTGINLAAGVLSPSLLRNTAVWVSSPHAGEMELRWMQGTDFSWRPQQGAHAAASTRNGLGAAASGHEAGYRYVLLGCGQVGAFCSRSSKHPAVGQKAQVLTASGGRLICPLELTFSSGTPAKSLTVKRWGRLRPLQMCKSHLNRLRTTSPEWLRKLLCLLLVIYQFKHCWRELKAAWENGLSVVIPKSFIICFPASLHAKCFKTSGLLTTQKKILCMVTPGNRRYGWGVCGESWVHAELPPVI